MNQVQVETPSQPATQPKITSHDDTPKGLTWRAFALGTALAMGLAILTPYSDFVRDNTYLVGNQLPVTVIFVIMFLCVVVNPLLGSRRLRRSEMAVAIAMMLIACAVPSSGLLRFFHSLVAGIIYYSGMEPHISQFAKIMPAWLVPSNDAHSPIIQQITTGIDSRHGDTLTSTVAPWIKPYLAWDWFIVSIFLAMIFVCVLLRRQWVVRERLSYPLATIPLELMAPPAPGRRLNDLWSSRLLWLGAAIPLFIHLINGCCKFWSNGSAIPLEINLSGSFTEFPWNNLSASVIKPKIYFSIIGATYFVPLEITFSACFFFLVYEFVRMFLISAGVPVTSTQRNCQSLGATLAYGVLLLWVAREHLLHVFKSAWLGRPREHDEYLSYRVTVIGLLLAMGSATAFLTLAGMQWWAAALLVVALLFFGMVLTRIVIDAGALFVLLPYGADPMVTFNVLFKGLGLLTIKDWFLTSLTQRMILADQRENIMPFTADALRLSDSSPSRSRVKVLLALIFALILALLASTAVHHAIHYTQGLNSLDSWTVNNCPHKVINEASDGLDTSAGATNANTWLHCLFGAFVLAVVGIGRVLFAGFPFHPIGLLLSGSGATYVAWFSIAIGWAVKFVLLRWGGGRVYQQARLFFIGLVVGDALAGIFWILVGLFAKWPNGSYQVLPG